MVSVILVSPRYGGNIGAVARAMKNFGFGRLVLVGGKVDEESRKYAVHAQEVLDDAEQLGDFEEVREAYDFLVGTTGIETTNDESFHRLGVSSEELPGKIAAVKGKIGICFGPEDIGLTNEQLGKCDLLVSIPTSRQYPVMNLSHAVAVLLYELAGKGAGTIRLATRDEFERVQNELMELLEGTDVQKPEVVELIFRRIFGRAVLSGREAHTILGVLKSLRKSKTT